MTKSKMANRYSLEVRALAAIAPKIGCIPQTLREWVKQAEKDSGMRDGATTEERDRIKHWNVRFANYARPMRSSARLRRILRRRNSTAH